MKKTLIISAYNRAHLLRRILISVSHQTCSLDKIIVADDGSKEDMIKVIEDEMHRFDCPIVFVTQKDDGFRLARSRNNALRVADEGILIFADQDMLFTKDYFKKLVISMKEKQFFAGYMLRLTEKQTEMISDDMVEANDYSGLITSDQKKASRKQFNKDRFYEWLYAMKLRPIGPKLRGGIFAVNKEDVTRVNGFDENYTGWGNEDDDLYWRLYASGVKGKNTICEEYAIHQYHPFFHAEGERVNKVYYKERKKQIMKGAWRCVNGIVNEDDSHCDVIVKEFLQ